VFLNKIVKICLEVFILFFIKENPEENQLCEKREEERSPQLNYSFLHNIHFIYISEEFTRNSDAIYLENVYIYSF